MVRREQADVTGLGRTKLYELQSDGSFPMRAQITDGLDRGGGARVAREAGGHWTVLTAKSAAHSRPQRS
jgi:hypothetical protein